MDRKKRQKVIDKHVSLHGWNCYYCNVPLVHIGNMQEVCDYYPPRISWTHCGCGMHDLIHQPCVRGESWSVKHGLPHQWFDIEHKTPRCRGGGDNLENLCLSCKDCNSKKHTRTSEEYLAEVGYMR